MENEIYNCPDAKRYNDPKERSDAVLTKWRNIISALKQGKEIQNFGDYSCAYCVEFKNGLADPEDNCHGCPIFDKTHEQYCRNTPFNTFNYDKTIENAQAELDFLMKISQENGWVSSPYEQNLSSLKQDLENLGIFDSIIIERGGVTAYYTGRFHGTSFPTMLELEEKYQASFYLRSDDKGTYVRFHSLSSYPSHPESKKPKQQEVFGYLECGTTCPEKYTITDPALANFIQSHNHKIRSVITKTTNHILPNTKTWTSNEAPVPQPKVSEHIPLKTFDEQDLEIKILRRAGHDHICFYKDKQFLGMYHIFSDIKGSAYWPSSEIGSSEIHDYDY